ncbi:MAG: hypothetical protein AAGU05_04940, partial [Anaerolineaceae bacterium]
MTTDTDVISIDMLRQLLAIQNELNEGLQGRLQRVKNRLVELIYQHAPQEADQQARAGQPPETQSEEALVERIQVLLERGKNGISSRMITPPAETLQQVQVRLKQAEDQVRRLEQEKQQVVEQLEAFKNQLNAIQQVNGQANREEVLPTLVVKPDSQATNTPDWFAEWQNGRGYENEERVIRLIGSSGLARRPALVALAQKVYQMGTSSFHYSLDRLIERGMVQKAEPVEKTASVSIDLLILTELGRDAYQRNTGQAA